MENEEIPEIRINEENAKSENNATKNRNRMNQTNQNESADEVASKNV